MSKGYYKRDEGFWFGVPRSRLAPVQGSGCGTTQNSLESLSWDRGDKMKMGHYIHLWNDEKWQAKVVKELSPTRISADTKEKKVASTAALLNRETCLGGWGVIEEWQK